MLKIVLPFCLFTAFSLVFLIAFLVVRTKRGAGPLALVLKTLASIFFVSGAIYAVYVNGLSLANMFIVLGLVFALLGDIVLDLKVAYPEGNRMYLNSGISSFSISNVLYLTGIVLLWNSLSKFWFFAIGTVVIALLFAVVVFLLAKPLKLDFTGYKVMVFIYSFLVALTATLSLGISFYVPGFALFAVGAILILISDLILSMQYFGGKQESKLLTILNHVIYYIGEILIMTYLFFQIVG